MTFYKLIKTVFYQNGLCVHTVRCGQDIVHVSNSPFVMRETGTILTPLYDSTTNILVGFTTA